MKKYIFIFIASVLFFLSIKIGSNYTSSSTQMIINTVSLHSPQVVENIGKELSKVKGISFYEISLQSNALLVNYNDKQVDDKDILDILKKWGCDTDAISFNPIFFPAFINSN